MATSPVKLDMSTRIMSELYINSINCVILVVALALIILIYVVFIGLYCLMGKDLQNVVLTIFQWGLSIRKIPFWVVVFHNKKDSIILGFRNILIFLLTSPNSFFELILNTTFEFEFFLRTCKKYEFTFLANFLYSCTKYEILVFLNNFDFGIIEIFKILTFLKYSIISENLQKGEFAVLAKFWYHCLDILFNNFNLFRWFCWIVSESFKTILSIIFFDEWC